MTTPTGRPRGRPKTKQYATLMARIPQDLVDRAQRYAALHRQSISVVIREGLLLLLDTDPYAHFMSDTKTPTTTAIMSDRKAAVPEIVSDTNGEIVSDMNRGTSKTTKQSSGMPVFDSTKYVLGKLCPRQHDYDGAGHSLLRISNRHCIACDREKFHERKQKRQALP